MQRREREIRSDKDQQPSISESLSKARKKLSPSFPVISRDSPVKGIPLASTFVASRASNMSYSVAIFLSLSPMIGKSTVVFEISLMSLIHLSWEAMSLAESPVWRERTINREMIRFRI